MNLLLALALSTRAAAAAAALAPAASPFSLAATLRGRVAGDAFGAGVAVSGGSGDALLLAAGATGASGGLGAIELFAATPAWAAAGPPLAPPPGPFGGAALGATLAFAPGLLASAVFTSYESQGGACVFSLPPEPALQQNITESTPGDELGSSLALDATAGSWLALGAPNFADGQGVVYVFRRNSVGGDAAPFARAQVLSAAADFPAAAAAASNFGASLALSGPTLAVSATAVEGGNGIVLLYKLVGASAWTPASILDAGARRGQGDAYGYALALSSGGALLLCGAPGLGRAFAHRADAAVQEIEAPSSAAASCSFGWSLALSADAGVLLIGTNCEVGGVAAVYTAGANGSFTLASVLANASSSSPDSFGLSVALSADGTIAIVGAPGALDAAGAVYIFAQALPSGGSGSIGDTSSATAATVGGAVGALAAAGLAAAALVVVRRRARAAAPSAAPIYAALPLA